MEKQTIQLTVNGTQHQVEVATRTTLLEVLRDDLGLTGTKNGCGQGHCGACTVIVNGRAVRACVTLARRADGAVVETIEGLARPRLPGGEQLHPLQQAFVEQGAIQCGFCTPGMIMAAKSLLDENPAPTEADIARALKRNLCRCTGYAKIVEAIQVASGQRATTGPLPDSQQSAVVGQRMPRPDAIAKATGAALFAADYRFPGMLHAKVLRSAHPHARVLGIDASQARAASGVVAVLTADDVPGNKNHGVARNDWPVLAYDVVRYRGDAIAVVVAETKAQAKAALDLIAVDYEPLPAIFSPDEARQPDAPHLHPGGNLLKHTHVERGDVDAAFARADVIVEQVYHTPATDHAFLEPEAAVAVPAPMEDGGVHRTPCVTVYVGSQIPFKDRAQVASSLALPEEKVRIVQPAVGGAFGGKEDVSVQIHAALAAVVTGRPVKLVYTRQDSLRYHPKRHATTIRYKTGAARDGRLLAVAVEILGDTGAYASLGEFVMARTATHAAGPYDVPNVRLDSYALFTNNPPAGALRGFGVPQACFACETQMDILAERLGMDPLELRRRNAVRVGSTIATGQVLQESVGLLETIERVAEAMRDAEASQPADPTQRRGWGVACTFKNVGLGGPLPDSAGADVELTTAGRCLVRAGAAEIGQGLPAVLAQIAAQELGVPYDRVAVILADTGQTLDCGPTTASRQTFITGNAVRRAAIRVRESLAGAAAEELGAPPDTLVFADGRVRAADGDRSLTLTEAIVVAQREGRATRAQDIYTAPPTVGVETPGDTHFAYGYGTQAAEVKVDVETGQVRVLRVIAAHDVGHAINPLGVEGQLEGGVMMGLGYALTEEIELDEGRVVNDTFARYKVPGIEQRPRITSIIVEDPAAAGPYGAKGVGEITSIPTTAAITNAIHAATGARITQLPATPQRVLEALQRQP